MESAQKRKIEDIVRTRKRAHSYYVEKSEVYRSFLDLEAKTYRDGALTRRQKELIAIGISIALNCESCLEWHIREALESGDCEAEVLEAIDVGIEFAGGPGTVAARFAAAVLDYYAES